MNNLEEYGWNTFHQQNYQNLNSSGFEAARVISIKGFKYLLITNQGELDAELSGKLLYGAEPEALPKTGDWVLFVRYDTMGYITDLLPRANELHRKSPGTKTEKQVLAANIDFALIVQGLDRDFNLMRLDRYLVQIKACNITPVIILNKADLVDDTAPFFDQIAKLGRNCHVYTCSTYTGQGITELVSKLFEKNKTHILVGSSGVGKSSLMNTLTDSTFRQTGNISHSTGKGRHITTTRDLFRLPNGSLIIDTPGMREFGVVFDEESGSGSLFPLIEQYAVNCRYADCSHLEEEGCAVLEAYHNGSLDRHVYESYLKLTREQKHFQIKAEDKKRLGKQFGKMVREARDYRKKYKY